jgi:SPP1 family predicted phage head-tail adaptor
MSAGELRERVTFQQRSYQSDGYGNSEGDFGDAFTVAARIKPARGAESIQAARLAGREPVVITVRYSSDTAEIRTEWRAYDARSQKYYNIRSIVNPDEHKAYLDLECDGGVAT